MIVVGDSDSDTEGTPVHIVTLRMSSCLCSERMLSFLDLHDTI